LTIAARGHQERVKQLEERLMSITVEHDKTKQKLDNQESENFHIRGSISQFQMTASALKSHEQKVQLLTNELDNIRRAYAQQSYEIDNLKAAAARSAGLEEQIKRL